MVKDRIESHLRQVIQSSLSKPPEEMLEACLNILIEISGADGGSILGEEGQHLTFLFVDEPSLIGVKVPWDSIAGNTTRRSVVIYTYAPSDARHYRGIEVKKQTNYLLSVPIPSVHTARDDDSPHVGNAAGALQLLFNEDILPAYDVSAGPREVSLDQAREMDFYAKGLREVMLILPNIALGLEVMKLRQTSYQAIHELKNKMISAQSWLNCLQEDLAMIDETILEDDAVKEDIQLASNSIAEGSNLAKSYLQFTKIYNPEFQMVDVNALLRETAAGIRAYAETESRPDLQVALQLGENIEARQLDPSQLKMAFYNLGKNAAEALIEHGVGSEAGDAPPCVTLTSHQADDVLMIEIGDNGKGMPEEIASNLFVAFKTKKSGGTGLGLTITKKIVEVHNGTIRCETGSGGTHFFIQF